MKVYVAMKKMFLCLVLASQVLIISNINAAGPSQIGSEAEWLPPKKILVHTPGIELLLGVFHPAAALFERGFPTDIATKEHKQFINILRQNGAEVYTIKEALLLGTINKKGEAVPGKALDDLRAFSREFLTIDASKLPSELQVIQPDYVNTTLKQLSPNDLVDLILLRPTIHLESTNQNTGLTAKYEVAPLMNLYFLRDQMITTKKGIVIGNMNSIQRRPEAKIIKFALNKLGIQPIYEVTGDGRLEGGDFMMAGDVAFIGQGLRTNAEGVEQLLKNKVFGTPYVAVVKDSWKNQEEMHLDTYFNIIAPKLAVLVETRMGNSATSDTKVKSLVDVYKLQNNQYVLQQSNIPFKNYLEDQLKYKLIAVPKKDQLRYGINFLTIGPNKILAVRGSESEKYHRALLAANVDIIWVDFSALTGGYGAAHCTTQPFVRN